MISNDFGNLLETEPNTPRVGTTITDVSVPSNSEKVHLPVMNGVEVRFADDPGIHTAQGIDEMSKERRVPARLIEMSHGTRTVA